MDGLTVRRIDDVEVGLSTLISDGVGRKSASWWDGKPGDNESTTDRAITRLGSEGPS